MRLLRQLKASIPDRHPLRLAWHQLKAFLAALRYGFPARNLIVIGITGTDGKTTTVGMAAHILHEAGILVGALSTAFLQVKDRIEANPSQKTSPSPFVIQSFLRRLVNEGCTHAVLEYSSHGLVQGRLNWTWPAVAAITNTALEHLDYHGSMEQYRADKAILFRMLRGRGTKILNAEDETYELYRDIPPTKTVTYAKEHPADLCLSDMESTPSSCSAVLHVRQQTAHANTESQLPIHLNIPGAFNLENALCAIGCAAALGIPVKKSAEALQSFRAIPGRMERIEAGQPFSVFVDFTVTPQAFEKTLTTIRTMLALDKRILVLTGACGRRMREKRPLIGKICSDLADVVVITDDEPYDEDPEQIMEDMWRGIDQPKTDAHKILDRKEAIRLILSKAQPGDAVLLCGLGSYPTRQMKDRVIPWNEQEIARALLREIQKM